MIHFRSKTARFVFFLYLTFFLHTEIARAIESIQTKHLFDISIKDGVELKQPSAAVVGKDGHIYVLDGVNNRIAVFNDSGKFLHIFGKGGNGKGEFNFPLGITIDKSDRVYVADSGNHRVQVFTPKGEYLYHIDIPRGDGMKPPDPTDMTFTNDGRYLIIVDNENHRILYYSMAEHKFTRIVGEMDTKKGFRWPFSIAIDSDGYQYVVDVINTTVRVLNPEGKITIQIGRWGVDKGELFRPKGIALDSRERVYVSDSYIGVVQVFDKDGRFLFAVGDENGKVRRFVTPVRLYIDKLDRLFVTEMFANKISIYKIINPTKR